jgi:predicted AAA+ superfamily ATPase
MCAGPFEYHSLENPDTLQLALDDPRFFLKSIAGSAILDEIQNAPLLFSYLQEILDDKMDPRKFILTGSNSFQLNEKISQSLAGRIRLFQVLPLCLHELPSEDRSANLDQLILKGFYPRIYDENLDPYEWLGDYFQTYLKKDVKQLIQVADNNQFDRFVRILAGRIGRLGEYSSVAGEVGVSQPTAVRWASVLESSFIIFRLPPHHKNFNKRVIKSPKLYFYDTGLLCRLLRINSVNTLRTHPLRGAIFENLIVSEARKYFLASAQEAPTYFWRDQHGHEIDLIVDKGSYFHSVEIKSGATYHLDWLKHLKWFQELSPKTKPTLIYGGDKSFQTSAAQIVAWQDLPKHAKEWL